MNQGLRATRAILAAIALVPFQLVAAPAQGKAEAKAKEVKPDCATVLQIVSAGSHDYKPLQGRFIGEVEGVQSWNAAVLMPFARVCRVVNRKDGKPASYECKMRQGSCKRMDGDFKALAGAINSCLEGVVGPAEEKNTERSRESRWTLVDHSAQLRLSFGWALHCMAEFHLDNQR